MRCWYSCGSPATSAHVRIGAALDEWDTDANDVRCDTPRAHVGIGGYEYGASYGGKDEATPKLLPGLSKVYVRGHGAAIDTSSGAAVLAAAPLQKMVMDRYGAVAEDGEDGQFVNLCYSSNS